MTTITPNNNNSREKKRTTLLGTILLLLCVAGIIVFYQQSNVDFERRHSLLSIGGDSDPKSNRRDKDESLSETTSDTTQSRVLQQSTHDNDNPQSISQSQSQLHRNKKDPGDMIPVNCHSYLHENILGKLDDPNAGLIHAAQVPRGNAHHRKFWVSVHDKSFDKARWVLMKDRDYYEKRLSDAFAQVLNDNGGANNKRPQRVIDVGGNIGFFALLSAANGPVFVDSFEPNPLNRLRFCESLRLNGWTTEFDFDMDENYYNRSHVNLYDYGVGKEPGFFTFRPHQNNPGMGRFVRRGPGSKGTRVINLDQLAQARNWFETRPDIAILKVDVEGLDPFVIEGAHNLLKSKLVRNVFMEVTVEQRGKDMGDVVELNKRALQLLFDTGYELYKVGGFVGPTMEADFSGIDKENMAAKVDKIIEWAQRERSQQLNLWWRLPTTATSRA